MKQKHTKYTQINTNKSIYGNDRPALLSGPTWIGEVYIFAV